MRRFFCLLAFVASVSYADTNSVDLSTLENYTQSIRDSISDIKSYLDVDYWDLLTEIQTSTYLIDSKLRDFGTIFLGNRDSVFTSILQSLQSSDTNIVQILNYLQSIQGSSSDISYDVDIIATRLYACQQSLSNIYSMLSGISVTLNKILASSLSLPQIEAYQQSLALIVSNINNIVSDIGVTVNLPSTFDVRVQNMPDNINFNPAWDWQYKYIYGTGQPSSETLVWQNSLDLTDIRSTRWRLFPDMHNDVSFASWAGMLYEGLDQGFESLSSSGVRSVLLLNSISNINAQIYNLLSGLSPNTNLVATTDEQTEAASALRQQKLTTDSVNSELSSLDYTPNIYAESLPNISSRPRLSGVVSSHDSLSETVDFNIDVSGFFQTATDMGYTQFAHPDTTLSVDLRPVNEICIAVRQLFLMIFWMVTIALGAKLCLTVYGLYQTIWSSLMSSDSDIGGGQTVNAINYMRHILPQ